MAPVLGGIGVFAVIGLITLGLAVYIAGNDPDDERIVPSELHLGSTESWADEIAENGPLLFPGLDTVSGKRSIVVAHAGNDPKAGWSVYYAYPADRDASCHIEQLRDEDPSKFVDCDGRTLAATDLAAPTRGEHPELRDDLTELWVILRPSAGPVSTTTVAPSTSAGATSTTTLE